MPEPCPTGNVAGQQAIVMGQLGPVKRLFGFRLGGRRGNDEPQHVHARCIHVDEDQPALDLLALGGTEEEVIFLGTFRGTGPVVALGDGTRKIGFAAAFDKRIRDRRFPPLVISVVEIGGSLRQAAFHQFQITKRKVVVGIFGLGQPGRTERHGQNENGRAFEHGSFS